MRLNRLGAGCFKLEIMIFDCGWQIGLRVNNWYRRIKLPIPLLHQTIRYSITRQGLMKSIVRRFRVPPEIHK
jgi:hypothetical protein